ncbi:rCG46175 [Rattus norvegicus]|uniref:RCG46175 n=1 Tax=Rattus norvegicus TaxID=10116 RepID=A6IC50_RAT|nr:rCG46175 [Rattus norvegicus]
MSSSRKIWITGVPSDSGLQFTPEAVKLTRWNSHHHVQGVKHINRKSSNFQDSVSLCSTGCPRTCSTDWLVLNSEIHLPLPP